MILVLVLDDQESNIELHLAVDAFGLTKRLIALRNNKP